MRTNATRCPMISPGQASILVCVAFIILFTWPHAFAEELPQKICLFANGRCYAAIIVDAQASKQVQDSAKLLAKYFQLSTGTSLAVSEKPVGEKPIRIHVGLSEYVSRLGKVGKFEQLDGDGFIIDFPDGNNIIIAGPTDWGTEFGVYEFLERYVGVRWLFPGSKGEHVPEQSTLDIPIQEVREDPAFFSRQLSGLRGKAQTMWARRNRMHGRIQFHHNLLRLFPPEQYTKTHHEFFPIINGKRYLPPTNKTHGWQPCFTAPGIVREAIKNICTYFSEHPDKTSYSLGINDSGGHCECKKCLARDSGKKNFLGRRDLSDRYFEWANAVVKGVLKKYPDKWFGCLAYSEVAQPPSRIKVHPRIIPYLTYDRMKWIDKDIESEGHSITEWCSREASFVGWYDYIYGTPYCLPRVYFHKMADYYQYGHAHGVRAMYAEAYPNWGEGPKLYVTLKLQWNPNLDVDALLEEWYVCAVGEAAAPDLAAYYDHWEQFWTERVMKSKWFSKGGQYLRFGDSTYLDVVTFDDISKSRKLLEAVVAKTKTEKQRDRAELLLRAFEYYEASAVSYFGLVKNIQEPGKNKEYYENMNKKRYQLANEFEDDPVLIHPTRFDKRDMFKW